MKILGRSGMGMGGGGAAVSTYKKQQRKEGVLKVTYPFLSIEIGTCRRPHRCEPGQVLDTRPGEGSVARAPLGGERAGRDRADCVLLWAARFKYRVF